MDMNAKSLSDIDFEKRNGLLPVVVQDKKTKDILMLAYANRKPLPTPSNRKCMVLEYFTQEIVDERRGIWQCPASVKNIGRL
jgi:phosphoribosyl-AMP cyclohydrolase